MGLSIMVPYNVVSNLGYLLQPIEVLQSCIHSTGRFGRPWTWSCSNIHSETGNLCQVSFQDRKLTFYMKTILPVNDLLRWLHRALRRGWGGCISDFCFPASSVSYLFDIIKILSQKEMRKNRESLYKAKYSINLQVRSILWWGRYAPA